MRILIEEYQYEVAAIKDVLYGIDPLTNIEGKVSIHYVGYYYNSLLKDCVFILPRYCFKVVKNQLRAGACIRQVQTGEIANLDEKNPLSQRERDFIYKFVCGFIGRLWFIKMTSGMTVLLYIMPK